jgi:hypothetical protein
MLRPAPHCTSPSHRADCVERLRHYKRPFVAELSHVFIEVVGAPYDDNPDSEINTEWENDLHVVAPSIPKFAPQRSTLSERLCCPFAVRLAVRLSPYTESSLDALAFSTWIHARDAAEQLCLIRLGGARAKSSATLQMAKSRWLKNEWQA